MSGYLGAGPVVGAAFSLRPLDAFDTRRADVLCTRCGRRCGLATPLVHDRAGRWTHQRCADG